MSSWAEMLSTIVMAAMAHWTPVWQHSYREKQEVTTSRYRDIAEAISKVVSEEGPILDDDGDGIQSALLMASIGAKESAFRADIVSCKRHGLGKAWGVFQYQGDKRRVCTTFNDEAKWIYGMVKHSFFVCKGLPVGDRLGFYTDGKCKANWQRSRARVLPALKFYDQLTGPGVEGMVTPPPFGMNL